jgi:hypothetical protein
MNMIELQDRLKGFSQEQLIQQMQAPDGSAPQFMVLSEITRRKKMQDEQMAQQAKQGDATVAEEVIAAAGVPQEGLPEMASAMAPQSSIAQNTGIGSLPQAQAQAPQGMYAGGPVRKMAEGGKVVVIRGRRFVQNADGSLTNEDGVRGGSSSSMAQDNSVSPATLAEGLNNYYPNADYAPIVQSVRPEVSGDLRPQTLEDMMPAMSADMIQSPALPSRYLPPDLDLTNPEVSEYRPEVSEFLNPPTAGAAMSAEDQYLADRAAAMQAGQAATAAGETPVMPHAERAEASLPPEESSIPDGLKDMLGTAWDVARNGNPILDAQNYGFNAIKDYFTEDPTGPADRDRQAFGEEIDTQADTDAEDGEDASGLPPDMPSDTPVQPQGASYSASVGVSGTGGAGAASTASGGYISELEAAMKRAEKTAEQDKWLALAQAGMALMASDSPTLGGAIGEAGVAGLEGFRSARDTYENTRMSLMQAINAQKVAGQKASGGGGRGGGKPPSIKDYMDGADTYGDALDMLAPVDELTGQRVYPTDPDRRRTAERLEAQQTAMIGAMLPPDLILSP